MKPRILHTKLPRNFEKFSLAFVEAFCSLRDYKPHFTISPTLSLESKEAKKEKFRNALIYLIK